MHEVGLLTQALELAEEEAKRAGAQRILKMKLRIGSLVGVVPEAMAFAFDVVSRGSLAEGGEFTWEEVPVLCRCRNGCPDFHPGDTAVFLCPKCGAASASVIEGRELHLVEIEIEQSNISSTASTALPTADSTSGVSSEENE